MTTLAALGFAAAAAAGVLAERVVSLFVVRAEEAEGLVVLGEDPVPDEPCAAEPEPPESEESAHAAPAPARIATPTPRPTARPPRRPTYAEALFVELITSPLGIEQTVPHLANPMGHSGYESRKQIPRSSGCEKPARRRDHGSRAQASANRDATVMPARGNSVNCHFCQFLAVSIPEQAFRPI
ncbi:hypothetical protein MHPYR_320022 [uncultured Mycobacterium sp.]|uniref:Uncharacterized protein n=1 Tax=uncultured Mycobacterium sp. TaxID=171292 RepID=A0A1Y5PJI2_9MYCO|nr:hypothetical protein MHPYR_300056 [uncultured Mycobacterium sp.]SBS76444.1 hypothetical protein MHPYR_320022 [uncultured Mycobacterium sp.]